MFFLMGCESLRKASIPNQQQQQQQQQNTPGLYDWQKNSKAFSQIACEIFPCLFANKSPSLPHPLSF